MARNIFRICTPYFRTLLHSNNAKSTPLLQTQAFQSCLKPAQQFKPIQSFHTSPKLSFHPVIFAIGKGVAKFIAVLSGRGFRNWWKNLPKDKRLYFVETVKRNRVKIYVGTAVGAAVFFVYFESHVQEMPITGHRRFIAFTKSQMKEIVDFESSTYMEEFKDKILPPDNILCKQIEKVATRLLSANKDLEEIREKTWSFIVVDDDQPDVFSLPNGQIFLKTGMVKLFANDGQLAVILAHEIAHCILGHGAEKVSYESLFDFIVIACLAGIWAIVPSDIFALIAHWFFDKVSQVILHLPYSRRVEIEADEIGLELLAKSCFDVRECSAFWSKMSILCKHSEFGLAEEFEWLSTHPSHETRSVFIDSILGKALQIRQECRCPQLPSLDPRVTAFMFKLQIEDEKSKPNGTTKAQSEPAA